MSHPMNGADSEDVRRQARSVVAALGLDGTPLAPGLVFSLLRAGFGVQTETLTGGVEVRACPEHYGPGSLLISWAPHEAAYTPLDPRVTQVEGIMTDALLNTVRALGFTAERLGVSYSVLVRARSADAPS
ncbi:hypothetical protein ACWC4C_39780 [Streptomyces olivaceoviridis]|uniref:hypothetical protein n=1 Tax=Streptomyces olivaceoviridis TaxID=1921 RepID=UPI00024BCEC5|nr:hypothetical protein SHJG_0830 [Streptomyces hygroscopicus subsp. jinggangensis 5008]AGF60329.1 hypothetical protein SHJGH_0663 [Streptomyces hygroscopicus subsp. jinggangensis TL01]